MAANMKNVGCYMGAAVLEKVRVRVRVRVREATWVLPS